jgi:general secretion pathway protein G
VNGSGRHARAGRRRSRAQHAAAARGFTLIELLVVMAIIGTLLAIAVPRYFRAVEHARETVLRHDLSILRESIDKYYSDLNEYPDTLQALADKRYVRAVPVDPFTKLADTWALVLSDDPDHPGIRDIHSGANDVLASDGSAVVSW